jgi:hypothetical protein
MDDVGGDRARARMLTPSILTALDGLDRRRESRRRPHSCAALHDDPRQTALPAFGGDNKMDFACGAESATAHHDLQ